VKSFLTAARPFIIDSLGVIFFAGLLALGVTPAAAAAIGLSITVGHIAFLKLSRRPVAALQWTVLVLVLASGLATFFTGDARFIMIKGSVIYAAIGFVLLKRGWMLRYLPAHVAAELEDVTTIFGFTWSGLMFATAAANLWLAVYYPALWPLFVSVVPFGSKILLFLVQFFVTRRMYRTRTSGRPAPDAKKNAESMMPTGLTSQDLREQVA
jgi:intracellular septation protein A